MSYILLANGESESKAIFDLHGSYVSVMWIKLKENTPLESVLGLNWYAQHDFKLQPNEKASFTKQLVFGGSCVVQVVSPQRR